MQINFTGIKNAGYEVRRYRQYFENDGDHCDFNELEDEHFLNIQLSDDIDGKDLTEFRDNVKRTGLKNYSHPIYPNMLSLAISKDVVQEGYAKNIDYQVYINEANKELALNDDNLFMFSYLSKLLNRIADTPNHKLKVEDAYLKADEAAESVILGENLKKTYGEAYSYEMQRIHSPKIVKEGAAKMAKLIQEMMMQYFEH